MDIQEIHNTETLGNFEPVGEIEPLKKKRYTPAHYRAQKRYREKFPEKYLEAQRAFYARKKNDPEWMQKFLERCKANNEKHRIKRIAEREALGLPIRGRGRPRKIQPVDLPLSLENPLPLEFEPLETFEV